jgi:hypothetical protein
MVRYGADLHSKSNLLASSRLILFFGRVIYDCGAQIVESIGKAEQLEFKISLYSGWRW